MIKDEALKLALEALEEFGEHHDVCPRYPTYAEPENYPPCNCGFEKAITAIKEALAQPEQEPVAWVNQANLNSAAIQRSRGGQGDTHTWSETPNAYHPVPLYTSPPHRKPLTDEEIDSIGKHMLGAGYGDNTDRDFARAIEAAHGIKGEA